MYKVLIVDDEQVIRKGITRSNPWEEWGFKVIGQAANGIEAIEFIKNDKPDVVLSDIRMPKMDGVALMRYLKQNYPEIKIIILSGYNDFEYLNMSIKNSVTEYLLKPTDPDEFETLFLRIKQKLDEERKRQADYEQLVQHYEEQKEYHYTKKMNLLLKGYIDEEQEYELVEELQQNCHIYFENCMVMACGIDKKATYNGKEVYELSSKVLKICNSNFNQLEGRFFFIEEEEIIGFVGKKETFLEEEIVDWAKKLQRIVREQLGTSISIGISLKCEDIECVRQCLEQARCGLHQKVFQGVEHIELYSKLKEEDFEYYMLSFDEEILKKAILEGDFHMIRQEMGRVFLHFQNRVLKDYSYVERMGLELLFNISRWSLRYQLRLEALMQELGLSYNDIYKIEHLTEEREWLEKILISLSQKMQMMKKQSTKGKGLAAQVKEFIDKEYQNNLISLDYIAEKVNKNSAYISKMFKKETGYNFSDYLTKKRLEKGKALLEETNLKVYEIAEQVGYADVSNFIKIFRKNIGSSPSEYRNLIGSGNYEEKDSENNKR